MEYLGFTLIDPTSLECNKITRKEFLDRKASDYNGRTAPVKSDINIYKSVLTFNYYFEVQDNYFEIKFISNVLIKSQNGRMYFHPANLEAMKCVSEIIAEIDLLVNHFCSHFSDIKDKIKYLSTAEIYSLALVVMGGFVFKGESG